MQLVPRYSIDLTLRDIGDALHSNELQSQNLEDCVGEMLGFKRHRLTGTWDGRTALRLILRAFGVKPGEFVVLPRWTCIQVHRAIVSEGAVPAFVDTPPDQFFPRPEDYARAVSQVKARFVVAISYWGYPVDLLQLRRLLPLGAVIIQDCALSLGSSFNEKPDGAEADAAFFSFGTGKPLCVGGGGLAMFPKDGVPKRLETIHLNDPLPSHCRGRLLKSFAKATIHRNFALFKLLKPKSRHTNPIRRRCEPIPGSLAKAPRWLLPLLKRKHAGFVNAIENRKRAAQVLSTASNRSPIRVLNEVEGIRWNYWHFVMIHSDEKSIEPTVTAAGKAGFEFLRPYLEVPDFDSAPDGQPDAPRWLLGPSLDLLTEPLIRRLAKVIAPSTNGYTLVPGHASA